MIHMSNIKRPVVDRLRKDMFSDPSQTSVSCSQVAKLKITEPIERGPKGEDVFKEKRDLLFKNVHVRRIFDEENKTLVYVAYSSRIGQDMNEPNSRWDSTSPRALDATGGTLSGVGALHERGDEFSLSCKAGGLEERFWNNSCYRSLDLPSTLIREQ